MLHRHPDLLWAALLTGVGVWFGLRRRTQDAALARLMAEAARATKH
ncbi:MAG TPA: hypothetical protein VEA41_17055 [Salinarimonas sp.]|jgi:hypothetical protein|nr:hypothetical protein [Salinarimonas sp.]